MTWETMEQREDKNNVTEDRDIECDPENGLILSQYYLPEEVLGHILSFVDEKTLAFGCRLLCQKWRVMVQNLALKRKAEREGCINVKENPSLSLKLNWVDYYWLIHKKPVGHNLLKNNCGQNGLKDWKILTNGGDGWVVEVSPQGAEDLPPVNSKGEPHPDFKGLSSCFATSFNSCTKVQLIELDKNGLTHNFMDNIQPPIQISEWTACRFDCGCVYEVKAALLDKDKATVVEFQARENFSHLPREIWHQVTHVFKDYGPGVRYIQFYHGGMDSQFWKGHYGSKMSGGSVIVFTSLKENSWDAPHD